MKKDPGPQIKNLNAVRFSISKNTNNSIFNKSNKVEIFDPFDLNGDQFNKGAQISKTKYIVRLRLYSVFVEIIQSSILDPDLDQPENWANSQKYKSCLDSAYQRTSRIHFLLKSN